jgi:hypothetical protein
MKIDFTKYTHGELHAIYMTALKHNQQADANKVYDILTTANYTPGGVDEVDIKWYIRSIKIKKYKNNK